jgi:hypothetical protein
VQAVGVLGRVHPEQHPVRVKAGRQRQLHDVPGACGVRVQLVDRRLHLLLGGVRRQVAANAGDAHLLAVTVLARNVGAAARVVADQHGAQARHGARPRQRRHAPAEILLDRRGGRPAVENPGGHRAPPAVIATALAKMLMKPLSGMLTKPLSRMLTKLLSGMLTELLSWTVAGSLSATLSRPNRAASGRPGMVSGRSDGRR